MPAPTLRLAIVAAVAAAVVAFAPDPALAFTWVNGGLFALATVDWALAPAPRRIGLEREVPPVVALDTPADVVWRVRNPLRRAIRVRLADELVPSLRPITRRTTLRVPAGAKVSGRTTIRPRRRGAFRLDGITLRVDGPLGLAARQRKLPVPGVLKVYPPFRSRREAELRMQRDRLLQVGLRAAQGRGGGTEFDSLREYTVDDEFRRMDWAATARARRPIVRTYRAERNQPVIVLLDIGRTMAGEVALPADGDHADGLVTVPRLDHAMDAVMMLTAVANRLGDRTGLVCFGDRVHRIVAPAAGRHHLAAVTEAMYALQPQLAESDYRGAFVETLTRFRRRALLVVLTEIASQAVPDTLLPALPLVLRSHLVLIGAVRDPEVEQWARSTPSEAGTAFRKAAAVQALAQREATVTRLRALGGVVVDALPGALAPQLTDAYLKAKSTGRL